MHECNNNFAFPLHSSIYTAILNIHCFFFPLVYIIAFLSETRILWINYVFIHPAFELYKKNWVFLSYLVNYFTNILYPFFCPLVYMKRDFYLDVYTILNQI